MSSPTELYLPPSLPYPIKLVKLAARTNSDVQRGTRLLDYSFTHRAPDAPPELRFGTWDASVEGTLARWNFTQGDSISERRARESPAVLILEPCKHGVQLGGLCCLCGKDMTRCVPHRHPHTPLPSAYVHSPPALTIPASRTRRVRPSR